MTTMRIENMTESCFRQDLQRGKRVESMVCSWINKKYPKAFVVDGKCSGFDIVIPETNSTIEVKYDPMSCQTGNIVVEFEMFKKKSGILATTADWWVFFDGHQFVRLAPTDIMLCIFENKLQATKFTGKGDSAEKQAFLVKKELLFSYGKVLPIPLTNTQH